jgi:hypothetical protein
VKRGGSLSFLVGTISNVLVMEIGWTDVGSGGYILVSCAHSNTSLFFVSDLIDFLVNQIVGMIFKTNSDKSFYVLVCFVCLFFKIKCKKRRVTILEVFRDSIWYMSQYFFSSYWYMFIKA